MVRILICMFGLILFVSCQRTTSGQITDKVSQKEKQDSIIEKYATNGAHQYSYLYDMDKWQEALDKGLAVDSTIAYLWQQKAMPYFKIKKYEVGMDYLDKAVLHNPMRYQPYRAFIKCIFAKTHRAAIVDFESCIKQWGDKYEMDHPYSFYIGLSYLQLNDYQGAEDYLQRAAMKYQKDFKEPHAIESFYLGIVYYEQKQYEKAIHYFDEAIEIYEELAEAYYYKAWCQYRMGHQEAEITFKEAVKYNKQGYTINEANAIYELYPYQLKRIEEE
ncbi:tetratricopeptide repeat protein [Myroides pelagicus]|uniref:Tetratricopeptide repeat protein n=1 Tax=Myroides pelagicus TaxID=270914 RepID=A0A7K1GPD5_9FLAO|nr:tetratricopeptide repeat protein [Myroides pelagicus]MEC4114647.1 tetratricopeptide repeat protein [Myroides pelagicus]MTH30727.1 tetratricopeptide repeat protein [Myroides pelagicus]